jgi:hypothetical protein
MLTANEMHNQYHDKGVNHDCRQDHHHGNHQRQNNRDILEGRSGHNR